ncbi:rplJ, partial [Symbiodinium natans]
MLPFPVGRLADEDVRRPHMQPIGAVTKKEPKTDLRMQPIGAVTKKEPKTETALRTVSAGVKRKQSDVIPIGAVPSAGAATNRQHVDMKSADAEEIPHGRLRGLRFLPLGACSISEKFAYTYGADKQMIGIKDVPENWGSIGARKARRFMQIQAIMRQLDRTFFFMAFNKEEMAASEMEEARGFFPSTVNVRHLKNTWVRKAMEGTDWEPMRDRIKGKNMFVFVENDKDLKPSIQAYMKIEKQFDRTAKLDALREDMSGSLTYDLQPMIGGMMSDEWTVMEPADVVKLKDFPTKTELIGQIAGSLKQVTTKLAVGVRQ